MPMYINNIKNNITENDNNITLIFTIIFLIFSNLFYLRVITYYQYLLILTISFIMCGSLKIFMI